MLTAIKRSGPARNYKGRVSKNSPTWYPGNDKGGKEEEERSNAGRRPAANGNTKKEIRNQKKRFLLWKFHQWALGAGRKTRQRRKTVHKGTETNGLRGIWGGVQNENWDQSLLGKGIDVTSACRKKKSS